MKAKMNIDAVYYILEKAKKDECAFTGFDEFKNVRNKLAFATLNIINEHYSSNMQVVNKRRKVP